MIHVGDCLKVLPTLAAESVDSIVTDPPYGLGFMGEAWDHAVPGVPFWAEMLRVAKPGAWLAAFSGTRTSHRMVCAIEDAGWEIRDTVMWVYGSGFPKSHNGEWGGTALKPAWEPITLARKPIKGTVAENFARHGTGGLNIDGCRVQVSDAGRDAVVGREFVAPADRVAYSGYADDGRRKPIEYAAEGRWPANVVHDGSDGVLAMFPDSDGSGAARILKRGTREGESWGMSDARGELRDAGSGSAARFFYCAKASREDRNAGCEGMPQRMTLAPNGAENAVGAARGSLSKPRENIHPTVKPTDLMRWLCRLVTPPGGVVLDPFAGSGSTGRAATAEGFQFIGIEMNPEYAEIASARIRAQQPGLSLGAA